MTDSDFIFDCVHLLYHKYNKTNFKRSGLYIHSNVLHAKQRKSISCLC